MGSGSGALVVTDALLPLGHANRPGLPLRPRGVVWHRTGKDHGALWLGRYFGRDSARIIREGSYGSSQYGVDEDGIVRYIPENEVAWHVAGDPSVPNSNRNQADLGVELCQFTDEPPRIRQRTYANAVALAADLCRRYGWTPRGINPADAAPYFTRHSDWDPRNRPSDTGDFLRWDDFLTDVERALAGTTTWTPAGFRLLGAERVTADALTAFARGRNPAFPEELARIYVTVCTEVGVRVSMAFAQMLHETGYWTSAMALERLNPAGIGVTGGTGPDGLPAGNRFGSYGQAVRAQVGHLLWYVGPHDERVCAHDPRHFGDHKGLPDDIRSLNGKWAVPGRTYGEAIAALAGQILMSAPPQAAQGGEDMSAELDAYKQALQKQLETTVYARLDALEVSVQRLAERKVTAHEHAAHEHTASVTVKLEAA